MSLGTFEVLNQSSIHRKQKADKNKPNNVRRPALKRQAGRQLFDHAGIRTTELPIPTQMHSTLVHQNFFLICCNQFISATSISSEWGQ